MEQQENNIEQSNSQVFKIQGMKRDLSESSFENSFAFENKNMRINIVDDDNTLMNLTNERGTLFSCKIKGFPIGVKKYDTDKILLITTTNSGSFNISNLKQEYCSGPTSIEDYDSFNIEDYSDYIYIICKDNDTLVKGRQIKKSKLGFSATNPLEIEHCKDGEKDYFYIADGQNMLKTFVLKNDSIIESNTNLDYCNRIGGTEKIIATDIQSDSGEFFSGVILYAFSYTTTQGHKTGLIDDTMQIPLTNYRSSMGLAPNTRCNIAMSITVKNLISTFKSIDIYSFYRSSLDGEIIVRKVKECAITGKDIVITDENKGEIISYSELITRFNNVLIPSTITQKNSTLFLGNIQTNNYGNLKKLIEKAGKITLYIDSQTVAFYNVYHYGIQLQDIYGNWSPVLYIKKTNSVSKARIPKDISEYAIAHGYIAYRIMISQIHETKKVVCEGVALPVISIDEGKYGINSYAQYSCDVHSYDIYNPKGRNRIVKDYRLHSVYSPDIEFNENFSIHKDTKYDIYYNVSDIYESYKFIDITLNGNTGVLYNNTSPDLGTVKWVNDTIVWTDAIYGYQKALQLLWTYSGPKDKIGENEILTDIYNLAMIDLKEKPTNFVIYTWQPSGSLNDSNGYTSVLRTKKISYKYKNSFSVSKNDVYDRSELYLYDGSTNNIPVDTAVYAGSVNHELYPSYWEMNENYSTYNKKGEQYFWDNNYEISNAKNYSLVISDSYRFNGQPIEVLDNNIKDGESIVPLWRYSAKTKSYNDNGITGIDDNNGLKGWYGTTLGIIKMDVPLDKVKEWGGKEESGSSIKIKVSNNYNRGNSIKLSYKTAKHVVVNLLGSETKENKNVLIIDDSVNSRNLSDYEIENGQWIACSPKCNFKDEEEVEIYSYLMYRWGTDFNIFDYKTGDPYQCLKTEPYSLSDTNQVTCVVEISNIESYINPMCRYDSLYKLINFNGVTSAMFNKMNMVYNQRNNFFIYPGITKSTITDDSLEKTILYSDMKIANEKYDTYINLSTTNFFTIDSYVNKINKLITYNDKLLCFSDDVIVHILYNENAVVNTESVGSLGIASSDSITGSQLITNTYGCLNKWSIGIYSNILYFNDDLNNKIIAFSGDFTCLNEELGIETLNNDIFGLSVWTPYKWGNTKLNIDKYSKDIHYTTNSIDIAFNTKISSFTSLYSYENVSYIETLSDKSLAFKYDNGYTNIYILRQGDYNYFFGKYEPYWTTVIINQNSLATKTLSNIEFSSEAYSNNIPDNNYTFDTVTLWNDYQSNKTRVDYKMFGQSLLKKKFRIWRVNRLRNGTKYVKRNYDMVSNTWSYMKLSSEKENTNKLTLHWIKLNYKNG